MNPTMTAPSGALVNPEDFLTHLGWMRGMALSILGDQALAEDAVSDTWLRVLKKPPQAGIPLGGWLRTTLQRNALRTIRARGRRDRVAEEKVRRTASEAEVADPVEQAEAVEFAVQALRQLEEPYRTTLLLHYFREMEPLRIAQELGISVSGVRTRLQRGREMLRSSFQRRYNGNWSAPLLLALGYKPIPLSMLTTGAGAGLGLSISTWGVLAAGAGVAVSLVVGFWPAASPGTLEAASLPKPAPVAVEADTSASQLAPAVPFVPEARLDAEFPLDGPDPELDDPVTTLRIQARALDGAPLLDALELVRSNSPFSLRTSLDRLPDVVPFDVQATLHSVLGGRFVPASLTGSLPHTGGWPQEDLGVLESALPAPFWCALCLGPVVLDQVEVSPGQNLCAFSVDPAQVSSSYAQVNIRLVDASTGAAVTTARASLDDLGSTSTGWSERPNGVWSFACLPGNRILNVAAPGRAPYNAWVRVEPGAQLEIGPIALEPAVQVEGTILAPDGQPLREATLLLEPFRTQPDGEPFFFQLVADTDHAGRFVFPAVAREHYQLAVIEKALPRAVWEVDARAGSVTLPILTCPAGVSIRFDADFPAGECHVVTIRNRSTGARFDSRRPRTGSSYLLLLPPGNYQAELGQPILGLDRMGPSFTVADAPLEISLGG